MRIAHEAGVKVLLDGQGADEMLAGYVRYGATRLGGALRSRNALAATRVLAGGGGPLRATLGYAALGVGRLPLLLNRRRMPQKWLGRVARSSRMRIEEPAVPARNASREAAVAGPRGGQPAGSAALRGPQLDGPLDRGPGPVPRSPPRGGKPAAAGPAQGRGTEGAQSRPAPGNDRHRPGGSSGPSRQGRVPVPGAPLAPRGRGFLAEPGGPLARGVGRLHRSWRDSPGGRSSQGRRRPPRACCGGC